MICIYCSERIPANERLFHYFFGKGETVDPVIHPVEQVFSDEMNVSQIGPRGY